MTIKLGRRLALKVGLFWAALIGLGGSASRAADYAKPEGALDSTGTQAKPGRTFELAKALVSLTAQAMPLTEEQPVKIEDQLRLAKAELEVGEIGAGRARLDWLTDQIVADRSLWVRVRAWAQLAELRSLLKDSQASQTALAKAFQEAQADGHQEDRDSLLLEVAESLVRMGRLEEALRIVQALELDPEAKATLRAELLLGYLKYQVRVGDLGGGLATIASCPTLTEWWAAEDLVEAFWSDRNPERVLVLLKAVENDHLKVQAGLALGKAGYLDQAIGVFQSIEEPRLRAFGALDLAEVVIQSGLNTQPVRRTV